MDNIFQRNQKQANKNIQQLKKNIPKTAPDSDDENDKIKQNKNFKANKIYGKWNRWNYQQNKLYIKFLQENAHLFRYKSVRRGRQIFILLAEKMNGRRTAAQCKSHHQKMQKATQKGTIKQILAYMKHKQYQILSQPTSNKFKLQKIDNEIVPQNTVNVTTIKKQTNFQIKIKINIAVIQCW